MARSLSGEANSAEEAELLQLLKNDFDLQQLYELLQRTWKKEHDQDGGDHSNDAGENISRILEMAALKAAEPVVATAVRVKKRKLRWFYIVPVTGVIVGAIFLFAGRNSQPETSPAANVKVLAAQNGSRSKTILPDGSTVWLNAGSKIYYDKDFSGALREVKLEGEAFFDVQKDAGKPFIVHTAGVDIKVLGTAFNVKSYPGDKTVETTLLRGLVEVSRDNYIPQQPIVLHPNEKIIIDKDGDLEEGAAPEKVTATQKMPPIIFKIVHLEVTEKDEPPAETAWVSDRLVFRGEDFITLARKLERWYNVTVVFEDEASKHLNFTGSFENETAAQAFEALKTASGFDYKIEDNVVHVHSLY